MRLDAQMVYYDKSGMVDEAEELNAMAPGRKVAERLERSKGT